MNAIEIICVGGIAWILLGLVFGLAIGPVLKRVGERYPEA